MFRLGYSILFLFFETLFFVKIKAYRFCAASNHFFLLKILFSKNP